MVQNDGIQEAGDQVIFQSAIYDTPDHILHCTDVVFGDFVQRTLPCSHRVDESLETWEPPGRSRIRAVHKLLQQGTDPIFQTGHEESSNFVDIEAIFL